MERFEEHRIQLLPSNVSLKCYNAIPIQPYLDYMETILEPKRIPSEYVHRATNEKRNKTAECIHSNDTLKAEVTKYLEENSDIFKFCKKCMGSEDMLF